MSDPVPPILPPPVPPTGPVGTPGTTPLVPRCPKCTYALEGHAESGVCPECGGRYASADRFAYATAGGFWKAFLAFSWPAAWAFVVVAAASSTTSDEIVFGLLSLGVLLLLVNSVVVAFRILRRWRVRRLRPGEVLVVTPVLYAEAFGCGLLAATAIFSVTFFVGCAAVLLFTLR